MPPSGTLRSRCAWFLLLGCEPRSGCVSVPSIPLITSWAGTSSTEERARSPLSICHLVFWLDHTKLVFSSSIRYERKIGTVIWPAVSIIHHRAVPYLLRHAIHRFSS